MAVTPAESDPSVLASARRKVYLRILPLCFVSYVIAYIDRSNVAIAKLTMFKQFGWANDVFSIGVGMFFIGYFLLEIPGGLIVERWSARKWVSRIMVSWGVIAAMQALVKTPTQFYTARFFLGLAEAGFFPAIVVYLSHWFPARDRAKALALFVMAAPAAQIVSNPPSYFLLRIGTTEIVDGRSVTYPLVLGLEGWQWLFIAWGIPAVVLGILIIFIMTDRPAHARWLTPAEKAALTAEIDRDRVEDAHQGASHVRVLWRALCDWRVLLLCAANLSIVCGHYGVESFLPSILKQWYEDLPLRWLSWLLPLPFIAMLLGQLTISWSSDRTGERWWHTAGPMLVGSAALFAVPFTKGALVLTMLAFALGLAGIRSYLPPFYTLPRLFLTTSTAAGGIGIINAFGNLGGFVGPFAVGHVEKATGSFQGGMWFLSATALVAGSLIVLLRHLHLRSNRAVAEAAQAA